LVVELRTVAQRMVVEFKNSTAQRGYGVVVESMSRGLQGLVMEFMNRRSVAQRMVMVFMNQSPGEWLWILRTMVHRD
jgi:hypothetical protein